MIKNWNINDILKIKETKTLNIHEIISIVEQFDSLNTFRNSSHPLVHKLNPSLLFSDNKKLIEDNVNKNLELCEKHNIKLISFWDEEYPFLLKNIHYPPLILYVKGNLQVSDAKSISVVGTRNHTVYGKLATEKFVEEFVRNGLIITSGLANGIDTRAHLETIKNNGITYAIIASGIDCINPAVSKKIADKIIEANGAIISEYPCGTNALPALFSQRNRIISGISTATLVIESAEIGGSLITAKFAFDQGRTVFALPGNIFSEKSQGTHNLIVKNVALPAISPEYVLNELGIEPSENKLNFESEKNIELDENEKKLFDVINHEPRQIDDIAALSGLEIPNALIKLLELEFRGLIRQLPGKYYVKI